MGFIRIIIENMLQTMEVYAGNIYQWWFGWDLYTNYYPVVRREGAKERLGYSSSLDIPEMKWGAGHGATN